VTFEEKVKRTRRRGQEKSRSSPHRHAAGAREDRRERARHRDPGRIREGAVSDEDLRMRRIEGFKDAPREDQSSLTRRLEDHRSPKLHGGQHWQTKKFHQGGPSTTPGCVRGSTDARISRATAPPARSSCAYCADDNEREAMRKSDGLDVRHGRESSRSGQERLDATQESDLNHWGYTTIWCRQETRLSWACRRISRACRPASRAR